MKKVQLYSFAITLSFLFSEVSLAKDAGKTFLNQDFFSLSKKKESAFDAPSAVYVLSSEDIRRSGVTSIPEALRLVPGLQVARLSGNKWAISSRGFNRQYSNKLLILIDGRAIYTPIFSGAFWDDQDYLIEDISKIEVIKGPGGSIWGANAMNGIINIITKNASETQGGYVSQTVGNNDKSITEVRYGGKINNADGYRVYAKNSARGSFKKVTDGTDSNDSLGQRHVGFKYDVMSLQDASLTVHGDFFNNKADNYFSNFSSLIDPVENNKKSTGGNLTSNFNKTFSKKSSLVAQTYFDYSGFNTPVLSIIQRSFDFDFQHFYSFSSENQLSWGLGYRDVQYNIKEAQINFENTSYYPILYGENTPSLATYSAFIQEKFGLIPNELYLTIGSKFQHNNLTGFEYQPNARLAYYPSRNQTLWTAVSRAVRTPTLGEDNIQIRALATKNISVLVNQGNSNYSSENVIAYEAGYRVKPTNTTTLDIAAFFNNYSKLRTLDVFNSVPTNTNSGFGESYGFEIDGKWQAHAIWRLEASYDFLKTTLHLNKSSNELSTTRNTDPLEQTEGTSPRQQFKIRSLLNLSPQIEFDNMLFYVDSLSKAGSAITNATAQTRNYGAGIKAYTRWDTRAGYLVNKNFDVSIGIQNVLNKEHQEFSSSLFSYSIKVGRTYYLKAALQF